MSVPEFNEAEMLLLASSKALNTVRRFKVTAGPVTNSYDLAARIDDYFVAKHGQVPPRFYSVLDTLGQAQPKGT